MDKRSTGLLVHQYFYNSDPNTYQALVVALSEKKQVLFSMNKGNVELMHECYPNTRDGSVWEQEGSLCSTGKKDQ